MFQGDVRDNWRLRENNEPLTEKWVGRTVFYEEVPIWYADDKGNVFGSVTEMEKSGDELFPDDIGSETDDTQDGYGDEDATVYVDDEDELLDKLLEDVLSVQSTWMR